MSSTKLTLPASAQRVLAVATAGALLPLGLAGAASAQTAAPTPVDITQNACPADMVKDAGYTDISGVDSTNKLAINCISNYGIAQGTSSTTYNPTGTVNRSQMALFLTRLATQAGLTLDAKDAGFTDISGEGAAAQTAINQLANLGVAQGTTPTTYSPGLGVSRAQMASFINRLQAKIEKKTPSTDSFAVAAGTNDYFTDDNGSIAEADINAIAAGGIAAGTGGGTTNYSPGNGVSRAQMALFLARQLEVNVKAGNINSALTPAGFDNIQVTPTDTVTLVAITNPDTSATDDRVYNVTGLKAGVEYRVTLLQSSTVTGNGNTAKFTPDTMDATLASTGTVGASLTSVNGSTTVNNNTGPGSAATTSTGTTANTTAIFVAGTDGKASFTVDGSVAESVRPVVYRNGGGSTDGTFANGGKSPRLELKADGTAAEAFGLGGITTFTQDTSSATRLPELRTAAIVGTVTAGQQTPNNPVGTTVSYTFDENVVAGGTAAGPVAADFKVYNADNTVVTGTPTIVSASGATVNVRFTAVDTAAGAATLTLATVVQGAVTDVTGNTNPEGSAALGATSGGASTTLPAGVTRAPDLLSVGNFRQAAQPGTTAVDFTFDQAAFATSATGYHLVTIANANGVAGDNVVNGTGPAAGDTNAGGGTVVGGNGTTVLTVVFTNPDDNNAATTVSPTITAADVARATIDANTVRSTTATTGATTFNNVVQAADVSAAGNTAEPDLVSIELRPSTTAGGTDRVLFTFDQNVSAAPGPFTIYTSDDVARTSSGAGQVNSANGTQVLVPFAAASTAGVVGGSVGAGAVTVVATGTTVALTNEQDEVGVANTAAGAGQTAGATSGPDLTGVAINRATDQFGNPGSFSATYTFDETVDLAAAVPANFYLYLADGTRLTGSTLSTATRTTAQNNTVTVTGFTTVGTPAAGGAATTNPATQAQIGSATLGTVAAAAVQSTTASGTVEAGATNANPEGAQFTTGGTGTRAS